MHRNFGLSVRIASFTSNSVVFGVIMLASLCSFAQSQTLPANQGKMISIIDNSSMPTRPQWLDDHTVLVNRSWLMAWGRPGSANEFIPGSPEIAAFDAETGHEVKDDELLKRTKLHQKRPILMVAEVQDMVIGKGMENRRTILQIPDKVSRTKLNQKIPAAATKPANGLPHWELHTSRKTLLGIALSPDSKSVVFSEDGELFLIDLAGGTPRRILESVDSASFPVFSSDGKTIYYVGTADSKHEVFSADLASGHTTQLSKNMDVVTAPAVSPGGQRLVFSSRVGIEKPDDDSGNLWVMSLPGGTPERLTDSGRDQFPSFNPSGSYLAFQRQEGKIEKSKFLEYRTIIMRTHDYPVMH